METPDQVINRVINEQTDRVIAALGRKPARHVAREVGLSEQTITDFINKRRKPSLRTMTILAERYL